MEGLDSSFRRKPESRAPLVFWTPAFAGVTSLFTGSPCTSPLDSFRATSIESQMRWRSLRVDAFAVCGAVRDADAREQKAQVVVHLGDRGHGRAGIVGRISLFDRYCGRQAFDQIHVRLFHELQKLPGISRQTFHVPAL